MNPLQCVRSLAPVFLCSLVLAALTPAARGQGLQWRTDYNAARREAAQAGKPLLIDFSTDNCMWCKKLDETTFRDPAIVALLGEQYVTLRINADLVPALAQALRIQSYPTLVLAGPDGKILGTIEGYMEAARLTEHLQRVVMTVATPDWMARDLQEASKAVAGGDYARAVTLLKTIGEDGKTRPVQVKARQVLGELEQQAAGRLARAKQMEDRGQMLEAVDTLTDLLRAFAGTQAASEGATLLTRLADRPEIRDRQKSRRASELLAQARDDFRTQQFCACLERCETIAGAFMGSPEAAEAKQLTEQIKANPEWLARACESMQERLGAMYLTQADSWLAKGDAKQAAACLERAARACPGSARGQEALVRLNQLKGQPNAQTEFKKQ